MLKGNILRLGKKSLVFIEISTFAIERFKNIILISQNAYLKKKLLQKVISDCF